MYEKRPIKLFHRTIFYAQKDSYKIKHTEQHKNATPTDIQNKLFCVFSFRIKRNCEIYLSKHVKILQTSKIDQSKKI